MPEQHVSPEYVPKGLAQYLWEQINRGVSSFELLADRGDLYPQEVGFEISPLHEEGESLHLYLTRDRAVTPVDRQGQKLTPLTEKEYEELDPRDQQRYTPNPARGDNLPETILMIETADNDNNPS
ncbi:MAG: hypothetical protein AAGA60_30230 [Cyanobacteria bacterium P01_E01_bin.42]